MLVVILVLILNFVISYWNASVVGRYWTERGDLPKHIRTLLWSGAGMAVLGFFTVYIVIITLVLKEVHGFEFLSQVFLKKALEPATVELLVQNIMDLSYIMIVFPVLGLGFVIWGNSVAVAWQKRDGLSIGIAGYNTFAMAHNTISAARFLPKAIGSLAKGLSKNKSAAYLILMLLPISISLGAAFVTTIAIMRASDAKYQLGDASLEF